jgi:nucleotide-binding universal stress UspA family protein
VSRAFVVRQVLFPTDFSDVSRRAGRTAVAVAETFGARIHVLHVVPPVTDPTPAREALPDALAELATDPAPVVATVTGLPAREIVRYARGHGIDLVVMGTHGRTGFSHALLGSVAEAVVRRAPCPVLTIPAGTPEEGLAAPGFPEPAPARCVACQKASEDLICAACRALIRGEALERKRMEERAR